MSIEEETPVNGPQTPQNFTAPQPGQTAPCSEGGIVLSSPDVESKEGTCSCSKGTCYVDGQNKILP